MVIKQRLHLGVFNLANLVRVASQDVGHLIGVLGRLSVFLRDILLIRLINDGTEVLLEDDAIAFKDRGVSLLKIAPLLAVSVGLAMRKAR